MDALLFNNIIPKILCDSIINYFDNEKINKKNQNEYLYENFEIPKKDKKWSKIEIFIYKQLLISLKKYYDTIRNIKINNNTFDNTFQLKSFNIKKYTSSQNDIIINNFDKINNRYNKLTYVFFLNGDPNASIEITDNFNEKFIFHPEKDNLLIFPENIDYKYNFKLPNKNDSLYIITGQLHSAE